MKDFVKSIIGILVAVGLIIGVLAILRNINRRPSVILTSTDCAPPCWYGVEPGKSNALDTFDILNNLEQLKIDPLSEYDRNDVLTDYYWFFSKPIEDGGGTIYFKDNVVSAISITTTGSQLNVGDVIGKAGEPEVYWVELSSGENRVYLDVILVSQSVGYAAEVILDVENGEKTETIKKDSPVFKVVYFDPKMFDELWQTRILLTKPVLARSGSFTPWTGFKEIPVPTQ